MEKVEKFKSHILILYSLLDIFKKLSRNHLLTEEGRHCSYKLCAILSFLNKTNNLCYDLNNQC